MSAPNSTTSHAVEVFPATHNLLVDALLGGTRWAGSVPGGGNFLYYSFPWTSAASASWSGFNGGVYSALNEPSAAQRFGLNGVQMQAARDALQAWAHVSGLSFQEVAETSSGSTVGDIRIAFSSAGGAGVWGHAYEPTAGFASSGDVWLNTGASAATQGDWSPGRYNFMAMMHELGHALGLKHPGNYNVGGGGESSPFLPASLDNNRETVMSYTSITDNLFRQVTYGAGLPKFNYLEVQPDTPMILDIAAIQALYGANMTWHAGNDTYGFDPSTPFFRTIWDAGGNDTISIANFSLGSVINLNPGTYSSISMVSDPLPPGYTGGTTPTYTGVNNLGIAFGVTIENAVGGNGADTLYGNSANNSLMGGGGNDVIDGGGGIDTAFYSGARSGYALALTPGVSTVTDRSAGRDGTDSLTSVERLRFSDTLVAIDIGGSAGVTAKVLGAVFGKAEVVNQAYAGIGLQLLDGGMSYQDLMALALNARLGAGYSNAAEVTLLYQNLTGVAPGAADLAYWIGTIQSGQFTQASLGVMAADNNSNIANINLVGLVASGLQYLL
ncbi:Peptidase M10 serralysin C terminal [Polaromonas sp. OV174]|uniref:M10 family metallopeptidase C-terminal domain-containing protein n=1 Tax=Polaromonas sp. OV174 TaxID=1855300 RepID=UPI0008EF5F00|nr:M10 family metallopeptidase C-terminal domain-containing protein [Polaromonas sp. OV174]SFC18041.1 Peptidase M10 serralysin C terminal [Polaromonas sp. OV174]